MLKTHFIILCGAALGLLPLLTSPVHACREVVVWSAALASSPKAPAAGTAAIDFDFLHPGATVTVDAKSLKNVQAIELHVTRSFTDHTGPAVLTVYTASDGSLPASLVKKVTPADLHPQASAKVNSFADLVQAVLDGRAYVTVVPTAVAEKPQATLTGFIGMHKVVTYDDSAGEVHDSALHHVALLAE